MTPNKDFNFSAFQLQRLREIEKLPSFSHFCLDYSKPFNIDEKPRKPGVFVCVYYVGKDLVGERIGLKRILRTVKA